MPAFSPTIGKFGDVTARGKPWMLWYKRHRRLFYSIASGLLIITVVSLGWWFWYGRNIPAPGGTLDEGMVGFPQRLNPLYGQQNEVDAELTPLIYRGLLRYNQNNELVPDIAESIEASEDGTNFKIILGKHTWHDGKEVSARDVAFTIGLTQDASYNGPWSGSFSDVEVKIEDSNHITLVLKEPYAPFEQNLTIGLLPEHKLGGVNASDLADPAHAFNINPIGTGKLEFESMQTNQATKQVSQLSFHLSNGYIETIRYHFYDTLQSAMTDFKLGKLQALGSQYDNQLTYLSDFDKKQHNTTLQGQIYGLFFNTQNSSLVDTKARKALAYALPKQAALHKVFQDHAVLANNVYSPSHWAYSDTAETYNFNLDEAKKLWGELESKPKTVSLLIPNLPMHVSMAEEVKKGWSELGVEIKIEKKSGNDVGQLVEKGVGYDVVLLGEKSNRDPDRYSNWHSTQVPPLGLNISRLKNDRVDKALEDGRRLIDREERKAKYATFQDYLSRDAAVIWLYQPEYVYMWNQKVYGVKLDKIWNEQDRFATLEEWYINLAKR